MSARTEPSEPLSRARRSVSRKSALEGAFTRYVQALAACGEPEGAALDEVWQALRAALVWEMRRRALWQSPPSYLGVHGWPSWGLKEPGPGRTASALEELLCDCYAFIFLERLPRLRAHLELKDNIEGLVFLYLRNYLHDRQRSHDPLGSRIFEVLRAAVREAVAAGELWVVAGDPRIRSQTVLAAAPEARPEDAAEEAVLASAVRLWNDDLLPDLVTAVGVRRPPLVARLRRRLAALEAAGAAVFRLRAVLVPLKEDARRRWGAIYGAEGGESAFGDARATGDVAAVISVSEPEARHWEAMESFRHLVGCVYGRIDRLAEAKRTRRHLRNLWGFLHAHVREEDRLPSNRKLAALLGIPRDRFPGLWPILRRLSEHCRQADAGRRPAEERR